MSIAGIAGRCSTGASVYAVSVKYGYAADTRRI
jgi:hypothetical protein